jgi:hypothetical protein
MSCTALASVWMFMSLMLNSWASSGASAASRRSTCSAKMRCQGSLQPGGAGAAG